MEIDMTEKPPTILDLTGGEGSPWNRKLSAILAAHVRALSNRSSPSGKDEGYNYFLAITNTRLGCFYDAFAVSRPRIGHSGELETLDQAWDRFDRCYMINTRDGRQLYRLVAVRDTPRLRATLFIVAAEISTANPCNWIYGIRLPGYAQ